LIIDERPVNDPGGVSMRVLRSARWLLLIALLALIPASSYAGVFISVGIAPPVLPVYVQPACPEPGMIWTPGYWAYGDDGYYWVPGAWVPAPYEGALWTPPYWGWNDGIYVFHPGYWGLHVGYYGGVNYGFGYFGLGFVGGEWHGREFAYNTAVVNVNRTVIHNTYVNETVIHNTTIVNNHVAYAGGPGGIRHDPTREERVAMNEQHVAPTSFQQQHIQAARMDRASYFKANNGHPQNVVMTRPLPAEHRPAPAPVAVNANAGARGNFNAQPGGVHGNVATGVNTHAAQPVRPESRPAPVNQSQAHPAPQPQYRPVPQAQPQYRPAPQAQPQYHPAPQPQPRAEYRVPQPQPQYRPAPQPRPEFRPAPQARPEPQSRPAPQPRQESRPESRPHEHR
jgi:WXXGXW repeat (2 copies)